ncbi:hypothetical protein [Streptomyces mirabilis]|uniref:hypothetical protein n=1 Tax=Streptomyces mirabilis TaxID=68239 RepID=UPI0036CC1FA2
MTIRNAIRRTTALALFSSVFLGSLAGTGVAAPAASVPQCKGEFKHAVSNVKFARMPNGRLTWSFNLTAATKRNLGSLVNVSMP